MALVVAILYAINRGFVKTRFSETIFIDASALFVCCHFPIRSANVQFELQTVSSKPNWVFQFEVQTSTKLLIKKKHIL